MNFSVDKENKRMRVEREYAAPLPQVWAAWTQADMLDKWWAPKPWRAETKSMDFTEGGYWLYAMKGPDGEVHWARFDFTAIQPEVSYSGKDSFCDEDGNINHEFPGSDWKNTFTANGDKTNVVIELSFKDIKDMDKMIEMGFKEGFTAGLENLDALLAGKGIAELNNPFIYNALSNGVN